MRKRIIFIFLLLTMLILGGFNSTISNPSNSSEVTIVGQKNRSISSQIIEYLQSVYEH
jgi:hypothetical protein